MLEMVTLDSLVPAGHLLRKIEATVDFSFIHELVAPLYCPDNGRPALDPTLMFKALFIGYLFGVRSERQLVREIEVNVAYLSRLDRQRARFELEVGAVGLDAGYATAGIAQGLEERRILGVTGYRRPTPPKPGMLPKKAFEYAAAADGYRCPEGQLLSYATTDRTGYRHYKSDPVICRTCPLLASCTTNAKAERTLTRHVWQDARERADSYRLTPWGKRIYKRRKETVERSFADAKQLHGHRYARFRGLLAVTTQCLLAAAAQNIKKIAMALTALPAPHAA